jgi:hypothetical protein
VSSKLEELLYQGPITVNIGVTDFADALRAQGAPVVYVTWTPPAGGDPELMDLLDQLL